MNDEPMIAKFKCELCDLVFFEEYGREQHICFGTDDVCEHGALVDVPGIQCDKCEIVRLREALGEIEVMCSWGHSRGNIRMVAEKARLGMQSSTKEQT